MENRNLAAPVGTLPSLKWFLYGVSPWIVLLLIPKSKGIIFPALHEMCLFLLILLLTPCCFSIGARLAWKGRIEDGVWVKIARWLNLCGLAVCIGVEAVLVVLLLRRT